MFQQTSFYHFPKLVWIYSELKKRKNDCQTILLNETENSSNFSSLGHI